MKPKIAFFVINHISVGGVERVTSNLISMFIANNIYVHSLISLGNKNQKNPIISFQDNLKIISVSKKNIIKELSIYLEKEQITHLIFQGDNMSISKNILKAIEKTHCKAFLHYHGSPYAYLKKHLYWNDILENPVNIFKIIFSKIVYPFKKYKLFQNIKHSNDGFITVSKGVQEELNALYNTTFKNITAIHNPFSFHLEKSISVSSKDKTIIFVSRLERKHKNAFLSLKAWNLLYKKYPDWNFIILGDGSLFPIMSKFIKDSKIKNIHLLGEVNNVASYLEKSIISILTSDCEGFGMGLFESMGCKNVLISTKSDGGVIDLIQDNYNGFIVPKNDSIALANKIEILILDETLRTKMANNSYQKYLNLQSENIIEHWKNILFS